jgi:hypothetical protein
MLKWRRLLLAQRPALEAAFIRDQGILIFNAL